MLLEPRASWTQIPVHLLLYNCYPKLKVQDLCNCDPRTEKSAEGVVILSTSAWMCTRECASTLPVASRAFAAAGNLSPSDALSRRCRFRELSSARLLDLVSKLSNIT